ncbi:MAG: AGE family epimerase/isomerase [Paracoccaceae bacterium]
MMREMRRQQVRDWLCSDALVLWSRRGIDTVRGGAWEALDHSGRPLRRLDKRMRIHPRNAFVFAEATRQGLGDYGAQARGLFDYALGTGLRATSGRLAAGFTPSGGVTHAPHRLYDLAFMILAASGMERIGLGRAEDRAALLQALARLRTATGWHEELSHTTRRTQNSHMHLFEAATEMFEATSNPVWRDVAAECLALLKTQFLNPDGQVLEFFEADWQPVEDGQRIEPGHGAEWVHLIDRYETVTGQTSGVDLARMFEAVVESQTEAGLPPNATLPCDRKSRLWPQTEFLKAALVMQRRGYAVPPQARPGRIVTLIFRHYLSTPVAGGWYDERRADLTLCSRRMPSSSFYHLFGAFSAYLRA